MYNRIGFTCSSFDLLHAGHIAMLKESSENCDRLIVGLNVNPCKGGKYPVQSVVERYVQLSAVKFVDEIIPYNSESELIKLLLKQLAKIFYPLADFFICQSNGLKKGSSPWILI